METKHLTKDDLVYYNGKPVRINDLWQDFLQNLQTKDTENHQNKHIIWDLRSDKIAPIEISEDILLKSNFKKATTYDEGEFYYSKEDSEYYYNIRMCYRPTKNQWNIHTERFNVGENSKYFLREFDGCIKYVHELQHVLKAVGIEKEVIV